MSLVAPGRRALARPRPPLRVALALLAALALCLPVTACGGGSPRGASSTATLSIGAIPDQDQGKLQRLYGEVSGYLSRRLGVPVVYRPVTDYAASVSGFRLGDLDLVWFGGFTGVQAAQQVPGARSLAQRDIDRSFHSVFVASARSGLRPVATLGGLAELRGRRFTFGSETSTSGRLMPQFYLRQAGVRLGDLAGPVGYSGSHDATIREVQSGSYEAGAVNAQVWRSDLRAGRVDRTRIRAIFTTPGYPDYHWLARPDLDARFGRGFTARLRGALLALSPADPRQRAILELFGARRFVPTVPGEYRITERAVRELGLGR